MDVIFAHRHDDTGECVYVKFWEYGYLWVHTYIVSMKEIVRAFNYVIEKGWVCPTAPQCLDEFDLAELYKLGFLLGYVGMECPRD